MLRFEQNRRLLICRKMTTT